MPRLEFFPQKENDLFELDGKTYGRGSIVDVSDELAKALRASPSEFREPPVSTPQSPSGTAKKISQPDGRS